MLPPIENHDIPVARLRPLAYAANFDPSGWNAATPTPDRSTQRTTSQYDGDAAASAIPTPASATPPGISHIAPRRSDHSPNSGWISDDDACDASTTTPTSVYERENLSRRNGSSAGRAPFAKSVARWPLDRSPIARRSISARTRR